MGPEQFRRRSATTTQLVDLSASPLSYSQFTHLGPKIQGGAFALLMSTYQLAVDLTAIDARKSVVAIELTSGAKAILNSGAELAAAYTEVLGATLNIGENIAYKGDLSIVSGGVKIMANEQLTLSDVLNVHGTLAGNGTLAETAGSTTTIDGSGAVSVAHWTIDGDDARVSGIRIT